VGRGDGIATPACACFCALPARTHSRTHIGLTVLQGRGRKHNIMPPRCLLLPRLCLIAFLSACLRAAAHGAVSFVCLPDLWPLLPSLPPALHGTVAVYCTYMPALPPPPFHGLVHLTSLPHTAPLYLPCYSLHFFLLTPYTAPADIPTHAFLGSMPHLAQRLLPLSTSRRRLRRHCLLLRSGTCLLPIFLPPSACTLGSTRALLKLPAFACSSVSLPSPSSLPPACLPASIIKRHKHCVARCRLAGRAWQGSGMCCHSPNIQRTAARISNAAPWALADAFGGTQSDGRANPA